MPGRGCSTQLTVQLTIDTTHKVSVVMPALGKVSVPSFSGGTTTTSQVAFS